MRGCLKRIITTLLICCMIVTIFEIPVSAAGNGSPFLNSAGYVSMKSKSKVFDLPGQAKKKTYDTMQGGCTDGTYAYYVLYDRTKEKCKVSKVRMSDWKVVKTSGTLEIGHGNDLTYNSKTKEIVAVHWSIYKLRVSVINPITLKVKSFKDITIPDEVEGLDSSLRKKVKGIYGIAYNSSKKQYVVGVSSLGDFMILDQDFNVLRYCELAVKIDFTKQGMDSEGNYIYLAGSPGSYKYNSIAVYTWDGDFVNVIKINKSMEIENIFHYKGKYYVGYYTSLYKKVKKKTKLYRYGYVYRIEFKRAATIEYYAGGGKGRMADSVLYYGIPKVINANKFKKKGYKFVGWRVYRTSDKKYYGYNRAGRLGWYKKSSIKSYKYQKNQAIISKTASSGVIKMTAKWKKK